MKCRTCGLDGVDIKCQRCGTYMVSHSVEDQGAAVDRKPPPKEIEEPSLVEKASNFSKSVVSHARNGFTKTENTLKEKRLEICSSCEYFDSSRQGCKKCGCYLPVKASWASESCPLNKWGPETKRSKPKTCGECGKKKT